MISYDEIKNNREINTYIQKADESLGALGYTEHSFAHVCKVADTAAYLLEELGFSAREIELARIAGYMHDIGNVVNRDNHALSGAVMAFRILDHLGAEPEETAAIISAIGNHDESNAVAVNAPAAALILADKTDVRRSRVRNKDITAFDIHDRVNYAVVKSETKLKDNNKVFELKITIDTEHCSVMDYFEIFLKRMILCKKASEKLGIVFRLIVNEQQVV